MRFSLVLGTIGRVEELERFLKSLLVQTHRDFELIVADQNGDDRLVPLIEEYRKRFPMIHLRCQPGLSRARNVGLQHVRYEVVTFPDDDCWYSPDLLERVDTFWRENPDWDGALGRLIWEGSSGELTPRSLIPVNLYNVTTSVHSVTLFLSRSSIDAVQGFDEELGLGSGTPWGGGDDIDIIVRCLKAGFKICYNPALRVHHPDPYKGYAVIQRGFSYGAGLGRVLRKHRYPFWFVSYHWLRSLGASGLALLSGWPNKSRYYWAIFRGKLVGWRAGA